MRAQRLSMVLSLVLALPLAVLASDASVAVERVKPNKVLYWYDESATAEITLHNLTDAVQAGQLTVVDEWDLLEPRVIARQSIRLKPAETVVIPSRWNVGDKMYGHGLRASFTQDQREAVHGTEFYQVAEPRKWMRCFLINGGGDTEEKQMKADPFTTYINLHHYFAYMPSGFSLLAPPQDQWVGGQFNINFNKK